MNLEKNKTIQDIMHNQESLNFESKRKNRSRYTVLGNPKKIKRILIHKATFVITIDKSNHLKLLPYYSIYIVNGKIKEVFPADQSKISINEIDLIYDASKRGGIVITPGFINAHAHPPMYLLRSSMTLDKGNVEKQIAEMARLENKMKENDFFLGTVGDLTEEQKNGITTTFSHYGIFEPIDRAAKLIKHNVINAISAISNSHPSNSIEMVENILKNKKKYYTKPAIAIHYLHKADKKQLERIKKLIKKHNVIFTMHAAESEKWANDCINKFGKRTVEAAVDLGIANSNLLLSHCVHFSKEEIKLVKKHKIGVVHLPTSNRIHNTGDFKYPEFAKIGADKQICLGTDSVISKNSLDLLTEALQTRIVHMSKMRVMYEDLFKMMTSGAAQILKLGKVGKIMPNHRADLSFWKLKDRGFLPYSEKEPLSLVGNMITHGGRNIRDLMINGEFVISNRVHNLIDESELLAKLQEAHMKLRKRAKI